MRDREFVVRRFDDRRMDARLEAKREAMPGQLDGTTVSVLLPSGTNFTPLGEDHRLFANASGDADFFDEDVPRRDALYVVVPITVIYASIFLSGIVGNVSTCIVIARNKSMHTATNYYLFSLAISDLLLLLSGLPPEIYLVWSKYPYVFGEVFCILRGLAAETSSNATVLTITAFTVERYVAICHPFLSHTMSKLSRAVKLILVVWLLALAFAVPQALQFGIVEHASRDLEIVVCTYKTEIIAHSFELSTFLFFVVPMTLITVLYALIGLKLRKSNTMKRDSRRIVARRRNGTAAGGEAGAKDRSCRHHPGGSSRRVLKMLVAVVVAFFICWAPFHVQRLIAIYGTNSVDHVTSNSPWMEFLYLLFTYVSGVLYYVSTTINPILYNIMSNKFREAFMETLTRCCRVSGLKGRRHRQRRSYSTLSRSQQRTHGGIFGCGNGGTGTAQESTECSGNSVRDESVQQSLSGTAGYSVGGVVLVASRRSSNESATHWQSASSGFRGVGRRSSSRRAAGTEAAVSRENNPSETYTSDERSVGSCCRYRERWPIGGSGWSNAAGPGRDAPFAANGRDDRPSTPAVPARWRGSEGVGYEPRRPGDDKSKWTAIIYRPRRDTRAMWKRWRAFEWVPSRKRTPPSAPGMMLFCSSSTGIVRGADTAPGREEYSMTSRDVSNSSLRDVDRRALDEELSEYYAAGRTTRERETMTTTTTTTMMTTTTTTMMTTTTTTMMTTTTTTMMTTTTTTMMTTTTTTMMTTTSGHGSAEEKSSSSIGDRIGPVANETDETAQGCRKIRERKRSSGKDEVESFG